MTSARGFITCIAWTRDVLKQYGLGPKNISRVSPIITDMHRQIFTMYKDELSAVGDKGVYDLLSEVAFLDVQCIKGSKYSVECRILTPREREKQRTTLRN